MKAEERNEALKAIIEAVKPTMLSAEYLATNPDSDVIDRQVLGVIINRYFDFDVDAVIDTTFYALEDANFDRFGNKLKKDWEDYVEANFPPDEEESE